jgi:hypothetical protein
MLFAQAQLAFYENSLLIDSQTSPREWNQNAGLLSLVGGLMELEQKIDEMDRKIALLSQQIAQKE